MKLTNQYVAFFSATNTTRTLVRHIASKTGLATKKEYNITKSEGNNGVVTFTPSDLFIVGVPSYAGRIPQISISALNNFKGKNTPAIIVCTYGNRDYDDTLLELKDILVSNGFCIISAGAFVAQHSIFPKVGFNRPNEQDNIDTDTFTLESIRLLAETESINDLKEIQVKGNYPYKEIGNIPLHPTGNRKCDECGTCIHLCPTNAIPKDNPRKTDKGKCISCARCIAVCPQNARAFRGLIYKIASSKFVKKNLAPKPNITSFAKVVS